VTDRVLTPAAEKVIRHHARQNLMLGTRDTELVLAELERLRAERDLLRAALRTYCTCVNDGLEPTTGHDCPQFPCRAGVALKRAAVDAFDKEGR